MSKKTEALKLALEALEETRNALAWFYDSYPQDVTQRGSKLLPHVETVLTAIREALAEQPAQQEPVDGATLAGLYASISTLNTLVDQQRQLLVEVEDVFGRDGHGGPFEDGEFPLIDRVRAQIAAIAPPEQPAQPGRCHLCDCTGDIHSPDGEWRGACPHCNQPEKLEPVAHIPDEALEQLKPPMRILRGVPLYGYAGVGTTAVYTAPPQRKPLTHEQRLEVLTRFKKHDMEWDGPAILIDLVEAAHGIKESRNEI